MGQGQGIPLILQTLVLTIPPHLIPCAGLVSLAKLHIGEVICEGLDLDTSYVSKNTKNKRVCLLYNHVFQQKLAHGCLLAAKHTIYNGGKTMCFSTS